MSDSKEVRAVVYDGESSRLDRAIVGALNGDGTLTRSQVERMIEEGCVSVNGRGIVKPAHRVERGDTIELRIAPPPGSHLAPAEIPLEVLFEDHMVIVINKPAGISMHPGAGNRDGTIANAVVSHVGSSQLYVGEPNRPGIVHRLDKDTTGVVVIAKTSQAHAHLAKQFAERSVGRSYTAMVFSTPRAGRIIQRDDQGEVSAAIGRHPTDRRRMAVVQEGRPSITRWKVIERMMYGTLLECTLRTGRTHQIRVHMDYIRSPVIGDRTYGDFSSLPKPLHEAALAFGRQALHAATLAFSHPSTGERLSFSAKMPDDLSRLVEQFKSFRS